MHGNLTPQISLSPYYLNTNRIEVMAGSKIPAVARTLLSRNNSDRVNAMSFAADLADSAIRSGKLKNVAEAFAEAPSEGRFFGWTWGVFNFKGSAAAFRAEEAGKARQNPEINGTLRLADRELPAHGELHLEHYYSQSSIGQLAGRGTYFVVGQFEIGADSVEIFPWIIGDMVDDLSPFLNMSIRSSIRVYPEQIDAFANVRGTPRGGIKDLRALQAMSEAEVKAALAEIIGEPFVPADWGGEASDLQTNSLAVAGKPGSAAFILKGPALKGEMHPANMGKRGDQLIRAFGEPVDLILIQHCNKIANSVVKLAESFAVNPLDPKRFCILDGADSARILRAYGKLPAIDPDAKQAPKKKHSSKRSQP